MNAQCNHPTQHHLQPAPPLSSLTRRGTRGTRGTPHPTLTRTTTPYARLLISRLPAEPPAAPLHPRNPCRLPPSTPPSTRAPPPIAAKPPTPCSTAARGTPHHHQQHPPPKGRGEQEQIRAPVSRLNPPPCPCSLTPCRPPSPGISTRGTRPHPYPAPLTPDLACTLLPLLRPALATYALH